MKTMIDGEEPLVPTTGHIEDSAYREGRLDEKVRTDRVSDSVAKDAYSRGRRDERVRRRGSPLLTFLVLIVVAIGAVMIYLAIQQRSFAGAGTVVDQKISKAADTVQAPIRGAADKAGDALQNAGANLKQDAGSGKN